MSGRPQCARARPTLHLAPNPNPNPTLTATPTPTPNLRRKMTAGGWEDVTILENLDPHLEVLTLTLTLTLTLP